MAASTFRKHYSPNGDVYVGELVNNVRHGRGTLYKRGNELVYDGKWVGGRLHGAGSIRRRVADRCYHRIYIGEFSNGQKHGEGKQFYRDNGTYNGQWRCGQRNGHGCMWFADGRLYIGGWQADRFHGHGTMVYGNKSKAFMVYGVSSVFHFFFFVVQDNSTPIAMWEIGKMVCDMVKEFSITLNVVARCKKEFG